MKSIKNYIFTQLAENKLSQEEALIYLEEISRKRRSTEDIAIIGMSCRLPGAKNADQFWQNLINRICSISEFPEYRRKDVEHVWKNPAYMEFLRGSPLDDTDNSDDIFDLNGYVDDFDKFDAAFFGISPREAMFMDPSQRIFLETAWEAIEDAGYGGKKIYGTRTGVFVGRLTEMPLYRYMTEPDSLHLTGSWDGILASRISYIFNFRGPALVLDTACSSGLVAIHLACQALKNRECDFAIAGGTCSSYGALKDRKGPMDMGAVESSEKQVRAFDDKASGTVWGEGFTALILKPLNKAVEDRDSIYGIIKASAVNNDGTSNGISAPNAAAQEELLAGAWKEAKINPETIAYIEAHGTGTALGDPIEIKGLTNAFRQFTTRKQFCGIGSVKNNIGHTVGASGIASLIKVLLAMKHGKIPATINFDVPNRYIDFSESPVYVNESLKVWERGETPRRAGINAFGFSGTNAHLVIEEAREMEKNSKKMAGPFYLTLSAKSEDIVKEYVMRYRQYLDNAAEDDPGDICYTASAGRGHYSNRLVLVFKDKTDLKNKIEMLCGSDFKAINTPDIFYGEYKVVNEHKEVKEKGEITEAVRRQYSSQASALMQELKSGRGGIDGSGGILKQICMLYVKGADIEWEEIYREHQMNRLHLPTYPFDRVRCWAGKKTARVSTLDRKEIKHPLVDRCLAESMEQDIFISGFSARKHWILSDHKIMNNSSVPGTVYIEMAREICTKYYGNAPVEIKNLLFYTPLMVKDDEVKIVHTLLKKEKDHFAFMVASKSSGEFEEDKWITHAEGEVFPLDVPKTYTCDIAAVKDKLREFKKHDAPNVSNTVFQFGPRWNNNRIIYAGVKESYATLELPVELQKDITDYTMHPALFDNGVNIMGYGAEDHAEAGEKSMYLPFSYKSIKILGRMPEKFYSHLKIGDAVFGETFTCDLTFFDPEGNIFTEITGYTIKKVHQTDFTMDKNNSMFAIRWVENHLLSGETDEITGTVMLLKDTKGISNKIAGMLKAGKTDIIEVEAGDGYRKLGPDQYRISGSLEDYSALFDDIKDIKISHIINLMTITDQTGDKGIDSMDSIAAIEGIEGIEGIETIEALDLKLKLGVYGFFHMIKALINKKIRGPIKITLISDYANDVTGNEPVIKPENAALSGLGKVIQEEYPHLALQSIDIDDFMRAEDIVKEITMKEHPLRVAYRKGKRYTEQLVRVDVKEDEKIEINEGNLYIITGGTGGIGLQIGKYLSSKNKVNIVLINRSKFPEKIKWDAIQKANQDERLCEKIRVLKEMEKNGAHVMCCSADISDYNEVKALLDNIRSRYRRINGIIHAAGIAGNGFLFNKEEKNFSAVVDPKIKGTWILNHLTRQDKPDFFVMFSSIMSLLGGAGQGDYCAANSFMDSFAAMGRRQGLKTIALNWPAWKETGMAVDNQLEGEGLFKAISNNDALEKYERAVNSKVTRIFPCDLNLEFLAANAYTLHFDLSNEIKSGMNKYKLKSSTDSVMQPENENFTDVAISGKHEEDYNETELKLAVIWANLLGLKKIDIYDNYHNLGGDSLLAPRMLKAILKEYPGMIDITDIFSYPSVLELAKYINLKMGKIQPEEEEPGRLTENKLMNLLDGLETGNTSIEGILEALSGTREE